MRSAVLLLVLICFLGLGFDSNLAAAPAVDEESRAFSQAKAVFNDGFLPEASSQFRLILEKYPRSRFKN